MGTARPGTASSPAACSGGAGRSGVPGSAVGAAASVVTTTPGKGRGATAALLLSRLDRGPGVAVGGQVDRPQAGRGPVDPSHLGARAALAQDHVGGVVGAALEQRGADGIGVDRDLGG